MMTVGRERILHFRAGRMGYNIFIRPDHEPKDVLRELRHAYMAFKKEGISGIPVCWLDDQPFFSPRDVMDHLFPDTFWSWCNELKWSVPDWS